MEPTALIREFKKHGWRMVPNPYSVVLELIEEDSPLLFDIAEAAVRELDTAPTFLVELLSHLDEEKLGRLAELAVELGDENECRFAVLSAAAYQSPAVLKPHLEYLSSLTVGPPTDMNPAWRTADEREVARLEASVSAGEAREDLQRLFETQRLDVIDHALGLPPAMDEKSVQSWALDSTLRISDRRASFLDTGPCHHLLFSPADPGDENGGPARMMALHPTHQLVSDDDFRRAFGGTLTGNCGLCGDSLHRLMDFSALPAAFKVRAQRLIIGTCLSCLGWEQETLSYRHGDDGLPHTLDGDGHFSEPQSPAEPLAETIVRISPTPYRWQEQRYGDRQNMHRLGGRPSWVQWADFPKCQQCQKVMPFLAQFDSNIETESGGEWLWGSGGACYVFWCDDCRVSALKWQCT